MEKNNMSYNTVTDEEVAKVLEKHPKDWNEEDGDTFARANKEDALRLGEALAKVVKEHPDWFGNDE